MKSSIALLCALMSTAETLPPLRFTDIAAKSRLDYRSKNGYRGGRKYFPQPMCGGVGVFDFDGDGLVDIFFTNGADFPSLEKADSSFYNRLYRNKGDGTFEDVTERAGLTGKDLGYSFGVAVGDFDNDGHPDLFIANLGGNTLYHNNGDGTFSDVTSRSGLNTKPDDVMSIGAAWFDYDNDGLLDLVISDYVHWTPAIDKECSLKGVSGYCSPKMYQGAPPRLYHNLGAGKFQDVTTQSGFGHYMGKGMGIAIGDVNGDGLMDVFIANDTLRNLLFINRGDGTFVEAALAWGVAYNEDGISVSGMGCDLKDMNNDGRPDLVYNDLMTQLFGLFLNVNGKRFDSISATSGVERMSREFSGWSIGFVDYDNDGWKDIFSANGDIDYSGTNSKQSSTMWRNVGGTRFENVSGQLGPDFSIQGYHRGSAFGDLNNDGFMDIVVTSLNAPPRILMNSGNGNHWLTLEVSGTKSNRDGIGAHVELTLASGLVLSNHVTTSVGFMSSSDRRVHFGIGKETRLKQLRIRWPSGKVQQIANPTADRVLRVREPQ